MKIKNKARNQHQRRKLLRMLRRRQKLKLKHLKLKSINMNQLDVFTFIIMKRVNLARNWFLKYPELINIHQRSPVCTILILKHGTAILRIKKKEKKRNLLNNGTMMLKQNTWDPNYSLIRLFSRVPT